MAQNGLSARLLRVLKARKRSQMVRIALYRANHLLGYWTPVLCPLSLMCAGREAMPVSAPIRGCCRSTAAGGSQRTQSRASRVRW